MRLTRCFRAECIKLLTRPAIHLTAAGALAVGLLLTWLQTPTILQMMLSGDPELAPGATYENMGFEMVSACQLGMVAVGAMAASGEYQDDGLRTSLLAMPNRASLLTAQTIVLSLFCLAVAAVSVTSISLVAQARMGAYSVLVAGTPSELLCDWAGAILFWVASALIAFFLTHVFRSVVVPLFTMVCLSLSTYAVLSLTSLARLLPTTAGILLYDPLSITSSYPDAALTRPQAAMVVTAWVAIVGCAAAMLFARRPSE